MSYQLLRKRKYTSITFSINHNPLKLRMVKQDFRSFYYWLLKNNYDWTAINVYDRHSKVFIVQLTQKNYWFKINSL